MWMALLLLLLIVYVDDIIIIIIIIIIIFVKCVDDIILIGDNMVEMKSFEEVSSR